MHESKSITFFVSTLFRIFCTYVSFMISFSFYLSSSPARAVYLSPSHSLSFSLISRPLSLPSSLSSSLSHSLPLPLPLCALSRPSFPSISPFLHLPLKPSFYSLPSSYLSCSITHLTDTLKKKLSSELQSTLEGWYGGELELTSIYGVRWVQLIYISMLKETLHYSI